MSNKDEVYAAYAKEIAKAMESRVFEAVQRQFKSQEDYYKECFRVAANACVEVMDRILTAHTARLDRIEARVLLMSERAGVTEEDLE